MTMRIVRRNACLAAVGLAAAAVSTARAANPEGEKVFQESCTQCHSKGNHPLDAVRHTRAQWKDEVERMEGMGAEIPKGKRMEALLDWLAETHGPADAKK